MLRSPEKIWFIVAWIFIAALFADAINVTDMVPDAITMHSDEGNVDPSLSPESPSTTASEQTDTNQQTNRKQDAQKPAAAKIVIFDQDSPSLAAETATSENASAAFPEEQHPFYCNPLLSESLYLKLCTLLI